MPDQSVYYKYRSLENFRLFMDIIVNNRLYAAKYSLQHFENLMNILNIKKLSSLEKTHSPYDEKRKLDMTKYRLILHFVYDSLFTKYPDVYKHINGNDEAKLQQINLLDEIIFYQDIKVKITVVSESIQVDSEKYFFKNTALCLLNEKDLFKIIANNFEAISDKDIKDFYSRVIEGNETVQEFYEEEGIKEKQNFELVISDNIIKNQSDDSSQPPKHDIPIGIHNSSNHDHTNGAQSQKTAEEERSDRKSATDQIESHHGGGNFNNSDNETNPNSVTDDQKYEEAHRKRQNNLYTKILSESSSGISPQTTRKIQNEINIQNSSSPNSTGHNQKKLKKYGDKETKNTFKRRDWYLGQCQICGFTFKAKDGNHCERLTWTDFGRGQWTDKQKAMPGHNLIDEGNSLCLCSRCHSIIKHGGQFKASFLTDDFKEKLKSEDFNYRNFIDDMEFDKPLNTPECFKYHVEWKDMYFVNIELNSEETNIYFTEEHLLKFFVFLKS